MGNISYPIRKPNNVSEQQMRLLGLVKYSEEEEKIVVKSWMLGFLGIPIGALVGIHLGFFRKEVSTNPIDLLIADAPLFVTIGGFWWLITVIFSIVFWRKTDTGALKRLFPTVVMPILMWIYVVLIMEFIFAPLFDFLLRYYSPVSVFWYGFLVFLPFALLFIYLAIPDLRPRMRRNLRLAFTRSFWRKAWRNRKNRLWIIIYIAFFVYVIVEFLWKILHS